MEEALILILQLLIEIALQILAECPFDLLLWRREGRGAETGIGTWLSLAFVAGGGCGGLSLLVCPHTLIKVSAARVAYLFLAPMVSALVAFGITAGLGRRRSFQPSMGLHVGCAFFFALALTVVRFAFAQRP